MTDAPDPALLQAKRELRRRMRERARAVTPAERARDSHRICDQVLTSRWWQQAASVMLFASMPEELDLDPLLAAALTSGRTLVLPRFDPAAGVYVPVRIESLETQLRPGAFGIREPLPECLVFPPNQLDLTLFPGLAFDPQGRRLGRGKGYYDRMAPRLTGMRCGVAMDWQVVPAVPAGAQDERVNWIVTPTRWLQAGRALEP